MSLRFGIIGLGGIAHRFTKAVKDVDGAEIIAVASSNRERACDFAEKYGIQTFYDGYLKLLQDPDVDAVYIAQTHDKHFDLIKLCIDNNKTVLCEKPMVLTTAQAVEITAYAKGHNILLMEAMWTRFIPTYRKAKEWIRKGLIGDIKLIEASFCFNMPVMPEHRLFDPQRAGGALYDAGVYPIEFTTGLIDEYPLEVKACGTFCETGVDDFVAMTLKFKSGVMASLSCGFSAKTNRDGRISGSDGSIIIYDFLGSDRVERYSKDGTLKDSYELSFSDGFIFEIQHFIDLMKDDKVESPIITFKDNIATSVIFEDVLKQIKEK